MTNTRWWLSLAAVVVLFNLAVAQPLLDLLGRNPAFFVARGSHRLDILAFAVGVTLIAPLAVGAVVVATRRLGTTTAMLVESVTLAALFALYALNLQRQTIDTNAAVAIFVAVGAAIAGLLAWRRVAPFRTFVGYLSPLPVVLLAVFCFVSPTSDLLFHGPLTAVSGVTFHNAHPVVMIVFDEFAESALMNADGTLDKHAFPNLARLAHDSTWYRNDTAASDNTVFAVPAVLDGHTARANTLPTGSDHPVNLFTLLGGAYQLNVHEPVTDLCPPALCTAPLPDYPIKTRLHLLADDLWVIYRHQLLPKSLREALPPIDQSWGSFGRSNELTPAKPAVVRKGPNKWNRDNILATLGRNRDQTFDDFVQTIQRSARPSLNFLHMLLPHAPWMYLPNGSLVDSIRPYGLAGETWDTDPQAALSSYQRMLAQVRYLDRKVGQLIDHLKAQGMYDDSLIVLTADHGVAMRPGFPRRKIEPSTFGGVGYPPLFVKAPNQHTAAIDDRPLNNVDILPTILDILGAQLPKSVRFDGHSARDSSYHRRERTIYDIADGTRRYPIGQQALYAEARRKAALFRQPIASPWRIYGTGRYAALTGRRAAQIKHGAASGLRTTVDDRALFNSVDLRSGALPGYIHGSVERLDGTPPPQRVQLAVVVNGTIAGVTANFLHIDAAKRWAALLAPAAFRDGLDSLALYSITGPSTAPTLHAIEESDLAGALVRLAHTGSRTTIVGPALTPIRVDTNSVSGAVSADDAGNGSLTLAGWAADTVHGVPAGIVYLFDGDVIVATASVGAKRADVATKFAKPSLLRSGFAITINKALAAHVAKGTLRIFAVAGGRASELVYGHGLETLRR